MRLGNFRHFSLTDFYNNYKNKNMSRIKSRRGYENGNEEGEALAITFSAREQQLTTITSNVFKNSSSKLEGSPRRK